MRGSGTRNSVRRLCAEQNEALARELSRLHRERHERQGRTHQMRSMLDRFREQHRARAALSAVEASRFRRLHQRLTETIGAQEVFVHRLAVVVEGGPRSRHRDHSGVTAPIRPWTMLKDSSGGD